MDFIDGVPIPFSNFDPCDTQRLTNVYKQICRISYELSKLRFDQIGSMSTTPDPYVVLCPKFSWNGTQYGPFSNAHEYYRTLASHYWKDTMSSMDTGILTLVPESWTWKNATASEKDLFTAFLHLQCLRLLDSEILGPQFCLQHHDFKLRNILIKGLRIVAVIDWDECGTVPLIGYDPVSFAFTDDLDMCLQIFSEVEEAQSGDRSISHCYNSRAATLARFLETSLQPYRVCFAGEIFQFLYSMSWENTSDYMKRTCMQQALELAAS